MKFEEMSFSIIGGDLRQIKLCDHLIEQGYPVSVFGFSNMKMNPLAQKCGSLEEAIDYTDIVIGPIPCSQNDKDLFAAYHKPVIEVEDVIKAINKQQIFMAGRLTESIQKILVQYGITYIDLLQRDDMAIRNAIPTKFATLIFFNYFLYFYPF